MHDLLSPNKFIVDKDILSSALNIARPEIYWLKQPCPLPSLPKTQSPRNLIVPVPSGFAVEGSLLDRIDGDSHVAIPGLEDRSIFHFCAPSQKN
jgi:hypothetical protein